VHYKRRVREFGFTMLHGFIPTFYVDVTDIFMASRRARIVNALSGPLVHLFLAALYLWTASFPGRGCSRRFSPPPRSSSYSPSSSASIRSASSRWTATTSWWT
jgi:hypothetical protein